MPRVRIGADVGGTFTDVIQHAADGTAQFRKVLSTPPSYYEAVIEAIRQLSGPQPGKSEVGEVVNGTTVATNAVLERRGARTALVTTAGFRDVLELRRIRIPAMYDLFWRKPPALVERHLRIEAHQRVLADGSIETPLDEEDARQICRRLRAEGIEALAICFLHSYLYPDHEEHFARIAREELPGVAISTSSEIIREQGEYERTATTVVNAYVRPLMANYIEQIWSGLHAIQATPRLMIMQSSGGVMTADDAKVRPVFALESGPAAGVVAALGLARRLKQENIVTFDMGGTTAKASLIENGSVSRGREYETGGALSVGSRLLRGSGELLRIPTIDIAEVGAGGGSIAWIDEAGGLQVGPRSAGASPGPACYGRGGTHPTVTDANVVLGFIPTTPIADGEITIAKALAEKAVASIAEPLGLSLIEAAWGIHQLANARMMRALRAVSSEKGRDPREFALLAYGGSGPIHAAGLAEELGATTVIIPSAAGFFSAIGLLLARPEFHDVRACQLDARTLDIAVVEVLYREMEANLSRALGLTVRAEWVRSADIRYTGQTWQIEIPFPRPTIDRATLVELVARFEDEHERLYGVRGEAGSVIEIRAFRLAGIGPQTRQDAIAFHANGSGRPGRRVAHFGDESRNVPVARRSDIGATAVKGPLLIDEYDTTVVVGPQWLVWCDDGTNSLILERGDGGRRGSP